MFESHLKQPISLPTLTGSIVTFNSQYAGLPLKSHKIAVTATQSGSGTPSPDNVRTINGYSNIGISATGKNLWGGEGMLHSFQRLNMSGFSYNDETLTFQGNPSYGGKVLISNCFKPNTQYTFIITGFNWVGNQPNLVVNYADGRPGFIKFPNSSATKQTAIYTSLEGSTIKDISRIFYGGSTTLYYNECGLFEGDRTTDDFVPYGTDTTIQIGSTVYGGEYDARTGVLTVTHGYIASYNGEVINEPWISSMDKYVEGGTPTSGAQVVYPLSTPTTIQLPPCPIDTLEGVNNIWTDTGETTLQYIKLG